MKRLYLHSFALVGVLGTAALQTPQASQQAKAAISKKSIGGKNQYVKANEQLKQEWLKQEPEARRDLEKAGMKVEAVQKSARETIAAFGPEYGKVAFGPEYGRNNSAEWQNFTRLTDQIVSRLSSVNPAWRARGNDTVRRLIADRIWLEPEISAAPTPLTVNPNTVVTHYVAGTGPSIAGSGAFRIFQSAASYEQAGIEYDSALVEMVVPIPLNARTVRVALREMYASNSRVTNLVAWGYGSAETKFTISLRSPVNGVEYASASQSMQHSVFVIAGYYRDYNDTPPNIEVNWTRPAGNAEQNLKVVFKVECWAGGGPLGSMGYAGYEAQVKGFDVVTAR